MPTRTFDHVVTVLRNGRGRDDFEIPTQRGKSTCPVLNVQRQGPSATVMRVAHRINVGMRRTHRRYPDAPLTGPMLGSERLPGDIASWHVVTVDRSINFPSSRFWNQRAAN